VLTLAERLLTSAVLYERERGSSWEGIARYLGVPAEAAQERFMPFFAETYPGRG
jgi:hypothetical protein